MQWILCLNAVWVVSGDSCSGFHTYKCMYTYNKLPHLKWLYVSVSSCSSIGHDPAHSHFIWDEYCLGEWEFGVNKCQEEGCLSSLTPAISPLKIISPSVFSPMWMWCRFGEILCILGYANDSVFQMPTQIIKQWQHANSWILCMVAEAQNGSPWAGS